MTGNPLPIHVGEKTDPGRTRAQNEDSIGAFFTEKYARAGGQLFIVADGVGGESFGKVASEIAVNRTRDLFYSALEQNPELDPANVLKSVILQVNEEIYDEAESRLAAGHMATTIVAALLNGSQLTVVWVGDSRAYLIDGATGAAQQITTDHTEVQEQVSANLLSDAQAAAHPRRHVLSRSLGGDLEVEVEAVQGEVQHGDILLLCSDGLTRYVDGEELANYARKLGDPQNAAVKLVQKANDSGGKDNISVIVVQVGASKPLTKSEANTQLGAGSSAVTRRSSAAGRAGQRNNRGAIIGVGLVAVLAALVVVLLLVASGVGGGETTAALPGISTDATLTSQADSSESSAASQESGGVTVTVVNNGVDGPGGGDDLGDADAGVNDTAATATASATANASATADAQAAETQTAVVASAVAAARTADAAATTAAAPTVTPTLAAQWGVGRTLFVTEDTDVYVSAGGAPSPSVVLLQGERVTTATNHQGFHVYQVAREDWYHVRSLENSSTIGWVPARVLSEVFFAGPSVFTAGDPVTPADSQVEAAAGAEEESPPAGGQPPGPAQQFVADQVVYTWQPDTWLRETPGGNPVLGGPGSQGMNSNVELTILGGPEAHGGQWWWQVQVNSGMSQTGWVEDGSLKPDPYVPPPTETPTLIPTNTYPPPTPTPTTET